MVASTREFTEVGRQQVEGRELLAGRGLAVGWELEVDWELVPSQQQPAKELVATPSVSLTVEGQQRDNHTRTRLHRTTAHGVEHTLQHIL